MITLKLAEHHYRSARKKLTAMLKPEALDDLSVLARVRLAYRKGTRLAMVCGMVMGGSVPAFNFVFAHREVQAEPWKWVFVVAAAVFSSFSVYKFGKVAFGGKLEAFCYATLLEGALIWSKTEGAVGAALALLVAINAIWVGTNLVLQDRRVTRPKRHARARRRQVTAGGVARGAPAVATFRRSMPKGGTRRARPEQAAPGRARSAASRERTAPARPDPDEPSQAAARRRSTGRTRLPKMATRRTTDPRQLQLSGADDPGGSGGDVQS